MYDCFIFVYINCVYVQVVSIILDVSVKIYVGRVDVIYVEIYKVLIGLGRSGEKFKVDEDGKF